MMVFNRDLAEASAKKARELIVKMVNAAKASHVGSSLSVVDILSGLYSGIADISPQNFESDQRDIVIMSKGHAAAAFYSILHITGFISADDIDKYGQNGALLGGHVTSGIPGVELSTGSLGHGLPYGVGIALARKNDHKHGRVFVIMSDGECDEGTTWESALLANHHKLDNLVVIVDRNRLQSLTDTELTLKLEPFSAKWEAFGWTVREVNGHDVGQLNNACEASSSPICIIANTTKGKGVSFMENSVLWHYRTPNNEELIDALKQISVGER
jgi:transketolase